MKIGFIQFVMKRQLKLNKMMHQTRKMTTMQRDENNRKKNDENSSPIDSFCLN